MDYFADYNYEEEYYCSLNEKLKHCTRLMYLIIKHHDAEVVEKYLLEHPEEINAKNQRGWTALMLASIFANSHQNTQIVKILLKYGADVNIQDNDGYTALLMSVRNAGSYSNVETVCLLLENGANVNAQIITLCKDRRTALMIAVKNVNSGSNVETVRLLLENGADVNAEGNEKTALTCALENNNSIEIIQLLLRYGANPNVKTWKGILWLTHIIQKYPDRTDIIRLLLKYGAEIHLVDFDLSRIEQERTEIIELLLIYGLNPDLANYGKITLREYVDRNHQEITRYHRIIKMPIQSDFSKIFPELLSRVQDILYRPGSLRFQLLKCQWDTNQCHTLINYLGAYDTESFRIKVKDQIDHMH